MRNNHILGLILGCAVLPAASLAQTADSSKPNIQTYNTATSSTTIISAPPGYQSSVVSTYDGKEYHTVATSTPLTARDIQKMQNDMRAQEEAMNNMFQAQQAFFDEQNKMFDSLMSSAFPELAPVPIQPVVKKAAPKTPKVSIATSTPPVSSTTEPTVPAPAIESKPSFFQRFLHFFGF